MKATATAPVELYCRNCGARIAGHYCAECGQETRIALPTARQFMREAMGRLLAFDSRLWRTLFALMFRPGALTRAYLAGRRRYYVRPARLFLAMSLILFAVLRFEVGTIGVGDGFVVMKDDTPRDPAATKPAPTAAAGSAAPAPASADASDGDYYIGLDQDMNLTVRGANTPFKAEIQARLTRFNRLSRQEKGERLGEGALRYGSYVIFALLPVFAGLQYLSYIGRGRRYPGRPRLYAEHLVYAAHLHTFWFTVAIFALVVPWQPVHIALAIWIVWYIARARRVVYGGRWLGSAVRAVFVVVTYFLAVTLGFVALLFASILLR